MTALTPAQTVIARAMSEASLQSNVIDAAHRYGWLVMHSRTVNANGRWQTPLQGDAGFPDLVLARDGVLLLVELKAQAGGKWYPGQIEWAKALGNYWRKWLPENWLNGDVERALA